VMDNVPQYAGLMLQHDAIDINSGNTEVNHDGLTNAYLHSRYRSDVMICPTRGFRTTDWGISGSNSGRPSEGTGYGQAVDYLPVSIVFRPSTWGGQFARTANPTGAHLRGPIVGHRRATTHNNGGVINISITSS